jgi:ATP-dependent protease ClpP protease subunit
MLAENCGRPFDEVLESARRDNWLNSQEALDLDLSMRLLLQMNQHQ